MFLSKYLSKFNYELLLDNYEEDYLLSLDEEHFKNVYNLLKKYHFYFIEDVIVNYLEVFELEIDDIEEKILSLKNELGNNFVYLIGNDLRYINKFLVD